MWLLATRRNMSAYLTCVHLRDSLFGISSGFPCARNTVAAPPLQTTRRLCSLVFTGPHQQGASFPPRRIVLPIAHRDKTPTLHSSSS